MALVFQYIPQVNPEGHVYVLIHDLGKMYCDTFIFDDVGEIDSYHRELEVTESVWTSYHQINRIPHRSFGNLKLALLG